MSRTALAFLIAPLWVPAATGPCAIYILFPYPEQRHWVYITTIIAAVFAYEGVLTLGVPTFLILRARNCSALWIALVLGFGVGVITYLVFLILFGLSLGNSLTTVLSIFWHDLTAKPAVWSFFYQRARWEQLSG